MGGYTSKCEKKSKSLHPKCAVMPWGGDCTLGLAWEVAIMMPLQYLILEYAIHVVVDMSAEMLDTEARTMSANFRKKL
jgi:hypothetical protein